jgi:hypothetical protein
MNGLDELRAWTYHNAIESAIPIYCSRETYKLVEKEFSYMIDKNSASGSGAVPSFEWHRLEEGEPVSLFGADILPLPGEALEPQSTVTSLTFPALQFNTVSISPRRRAH